MNITMITTALCIVAFLSSILATVSWKKYESKLWIFVYVTVGVVTLIIVTYLNGDRVNYNEWGTPENYGQFGDFIGGLLNPVFGFLTVLILINSHNRQYRDSQLNENRKNCESLKVELVRDLQNFEILINQNALIDDSGNYSIASTCVPIKTPIDAKRYQALTSFMRARHEGTEAPEIDLPNQATILSASVSATTIIAMYSELIRLETFEYSKDIYVSRLFQFAISVRRLYLIDLNNCNSIQNFYLQHYKNRQLP